MREGDEMESKQTEIIGLIGHPVGHSMSPVMHNAMFKELGLNYHYVAFDVQPSQLKEAITGVKALQIKGFNVTIPHKVSILPFLDEISEEAKVIGAVNTVVNLDGRLIGYNTDGEGYLQSLIEETGVFLQDKKIVILGAGGAAKGISYAFAKHPIAKLTIVNRDLEKANQLTDVIKNRISVLSTTYEQLNEVLQEVDIVVNTTSIGMYPNINETILPKDWIKANHLISDIVYNPLETKLLKDAKDQGAMTHSGLGMFVHQGALAFKKWTGYDANPNLMKKIVLEKLTT